MRCSVTSTVLSTAWRNVVLSLDQGAPAATQHLRDKPLGVRSDHGCALFLSGPGLIDEGEAASTEVVPPSSGRLCGEVETVLLACIQAFLQFSQGIMRQLVAEAAFRDMRIGKTCR